MNKLKLNIQMFSDPYVDFKDYPDTTTPIDSYNLNKMQTDARDELGDVKKVIDYINTDHLGNIVLQGVKPKNLFNQKTIVPDSVSGGNVKGRLSSRQVVYLEPGTYTFSTNMPTDTFMYGLITADSPPPKNGSFTYDSGWLDTSSTTFTLTDIDAGYFMVNFKKVDNSQLMPHDIVDYEFQLEKGESATTYSVYQNLNADSTKIRFITTPDTNLDWYTEDGTYFFDGDVVPTNIPGNNVNGWLKVLSLGTPNIQNYHVKQIWYRCGTANSNDFEIYTRARHWDTAVWGSWRKILTEVDTEWKSLTITSSFKAYGNTAGNLPKIKKSGNTINLRGIIAPTAELGANAQTLLCTLPDGYRPSLQQNFICQGSSRNVWLLSVESNGNVYVSRYGTTSFIAIPTTAWLPFAVTYIL